MRKDDIRLLKIFNIPISYYTIIKELIVSLTPIGAVTFESCFRLDINSKNRLAIFGQGNLEEIDEHLAVLRGTDFMKIITDKGLFNFPDFASDSFWTCTSITFFEFNDIDTSNVTDMS